MIAVFGLCTLFFVELRVLCKAPWDVIFGKMQKFSKWAVEAKSKGVFVVKFELSKAVLKLRFFPQKIAVYMICNGLKYAVAFL